MGEQAGSKRLALDANLPLDLAADLDFAHEFRETLQSKCYSLFLAPTAAEEIFLIHRNSQHLRRALASRALRDLTKWGHRTAFDRALALNGLVITFPDNQTAQLASKEKR